MLAMRITPRRRGPRGGRSTAGPAGCRRPAGTVAKPVAHLLTVPSERHTAFAAKSVIDEVVFVTGPALVTFLATTFAPQAGLLAALTVGTIGTLALAVQRRTEPPAHPRDPTTGRDPMPWGLLVPLTAVAIAMGSVFGALEVATVAFAGDAGHKGLSGLMLGRVLARRRESRRRDVDHAEPRRLHRDCQRAEQRHGRVLDHIASSAKAAGVDFRTAAEIQDRQHAGEPDLSRGGERNP